MSDSVKIDIGEQKLPDEMTPEEIQAFMNELVTRQEAMSFMEGYFHEKILPEMMQQLNSQYNSAYAMIHILESIIISAGLCTLDELKKCYEDYIKLQDERSKHHPSTNDNK